MKYILLSNIHCNGKILEEGTITDLKMVSSKEIPSLIESKAIAMFDEKKIIESIVRGKSNDKKAKEDKDKVDEDIEEIAEQVEEIKADADAIEDINDIGIEVVDNTTEPVDTSKSGKTKKGKKKKK